VPEMEHMFVVKKYEILIYLTSWKTIGFKYLRGQATNEIGLLFIVRRYEILIYLTSGKTLEFKYLRCQAAKRIIISLKLALLH